MNPSAEIFVPRDEPVLNPKAIIFGPSQRQVPVGYEHGEGFVQGQDEFGGVGYVGAYVNSFEDQGYGAVWLGQLPNNEHYQDVKYQQYPQAPNQHLYVYGDQQIMNDGYYNDYRQLTPGPYQETFEHPLGRFQREKSQQEQAQFWEKPYGGENDQENMIARPQNFVATGYPPGFVNYGMDQYGRTLDAYGNYNNTPMASTPDQSFYGDFGQSNHYNQQTFPKGKRWGKNKSGRKAKAKQNKRYKQEQLRLTLEKEERNNTMQKNMLSLDGELGSSKQDSNNDLARDATVGDGISGGTSGSAENNDSKQGAASDATPQDAISPDDGESGSSNQDVIKQDFTRKAALEEAILGGNSVSSKKKKKNRAASARKAALQAALSMNGERPTALKEAVKPLGEITNTGGEQKKDSVQKKHDGEENDKTPFDGQTHKAWAEEIEGMFG